MSTEDSGHPGVPVEYATWRKNRWEEIAGPGGKAGTDQLAMISQPEPGVPGLPGRWEVSASGVLTLTVTAADGVSIGGRPVTGAVDVESGSQVELADGRVCFVQGWGGTFGMVVWDPSAPGLTRLRDIASYPYDPSWVVHAEYRPVPGRTIEVGRLTSPRSKETVPAPGDLVVELGGQEHTLMVLESVPGLRLAVFTDPSSGTDTPEIGRWLILPPGEGSTLRVDFNQVTLPHHAFSTAFPCPIPPESNHLPVVVDAGERALVLDGTSGSTVTEPDNEEQDGIMESELTEKAVQYLRHLEHFDFASMRAMCTDTATVWHNDGQGEQTIEENLEQLEQMSSGGGVVALRYEITRQFQKPDEVLQQHVLHISMPDGSGTELPVAMYFGFQGGLIDRIDEYANMTPPDEGSASVAS
ncbi:DUF1684 domain-containing protein [Brachybacterium sp. FME24]|uniref:DUF1684 domain-containing protein n=1 Tax=Brachybacterium sp. FME24 TaxID=2742605 RepID=UPI001865A506|nr:DUF1684 domain-containing protein [Brachybacterium sp. FME24]